MLVRTLVVQTPYQRVHQVVGQSPCKPAPNPRKCVRFACVPPSLREATSCTYEHFHVASMARTMRPIEENSMCGCRSRRGSQPRRCACRSRDERPRASVRRSSVTGRPPCCAPLAKRLPLTNDAPSSHHARPQRLDSVRLNFDPAGRPPGVASRPVVDSGDKAGAASARAAF